MVDFSSLSIKPWHSFHPTGLQLSANQLEAEENETLQMEMDRDGDKVYFLNDKDKYVRANGQSIQADVSTKW